MPFENDQFSKLIIHFKSFSKLDLCDKIQINNISGLGKRIPYYLILIKEIFDKIFLKLDVLYPLPFEK